MGFMEKIKAWVTSHKPLAGVLAAVCVIVVVVGAAFGVRLGMQAAKNAAIEPAVETIDIGTSTDMSVWNFDDEQDGLEEGDESTNVSDDAGIVKVADDYYRVADWSKYAETIGTIGQKMEWDGRYYVCSNTRESTEDTPEVLRDWATAGDGIGFELVHDDGTYTVVRFAQAGTPDAL